MNNAASDARTAAAALVATLEQLTATLARASNGDIEWLRPLALSCAELEYSALFRATIDAENVAGQCRDLEDLLARRYAAARAGSPIVGALHDRALTACRSLAQLAESAIAPTVRATGT